MNVFDILGPVMIGPSSSHTAGAARIGQITRMALGEEIVKAAIYFHGSFAETYRGHGTDRAIVGGLMGFAPGDYRIREALKLAGEKGLEISFFKENLGEVHPNTAKILCTGASGRDISLVASSIGGGSIRVVNLSSFPVDFSGELYTLIIPHTDRPGLVAAVTKFLAETHINIAQMRLTRENPGASAMLIIENDESCKQEVLERIKTIPCVLSVTQVRPI